MKKQGMVLAAVMTALAVTACGSGGGIVINGTTAAQQSGASAEGDGDLQGAESNEALVETKAPGSAGGTRIEIVTGETQPSPVPSTEEQTAEIPQTTAAPTTAAPTTAASATQPTPQTTAAPTSAARETTAAKTYAVTDVSKTMYATSSVRVRQSYSTSSEVLGALAEGESVQITGEAANGWMRVSWKGHEAYVSKSYLSDTAPASKPAAGETTANQTASNQTTANQNASNPAGTGSNGPTGPGSTSGSSNPAGPGSTSGSSNPAGPGSTSGSSNSAGPGSTTGASSGPGSTSGGTASGGGSASLTGSVVSLDPSGITVRTSDGGSRQFSWGDVSIPALAPGDQVQIQYSGSTVTQITK